MKDEEVTDKEIENYMDGYYKSSMETAIEALIYSKFPNAVISRLTIKAGFLEILFAEGHSVPEKEITAIIDELKQVSYIKT